MKAILTLSIDFMQCQPGVTKSQISQINFQKPCIFSFLYHTLDRRKRDNLRQSFGIFKINFTFVVCIPFQSSTSLTILASLWFIIVSFITVFLFQSITIFRFPSISAGNIVSGKTPLISKVNFSHQLIFSLFRFPERSSRCVSKFYFVQSSEGKICHRADEH